MTTTILTKYLERHADERDYLLIPRKVVKQADADLRKAAEQFQAGVDAARHKLSGEVKS